MNGDRDKREEDVCDRGGGHLFGEPESKLRNSYRCTEHKLIPASEVDWRGTDPYCPKCGQRLTRSASQKFEDDKKTS
jgi:hypothetical protein